MIAEGGGDVVIVIADVDRTLIEPGGSESDECALLFAALAAQEVSYGFATARGYPSLVSVLPRSISKAQFSIRSDGAILLAAPAAARNEPGLRVVHRCTVPDVLRVFDLVRSLRDFSAMTFAFLDDRSNYAVGTEDDFIGDIELSTILQGRPRLRLREILAVGREDVLSVGILADRLECEQFAVKLSSILKQSPDFRLRVFPEVRIPEQGLWWCEVSAELADKGAALGELVAGGHIDLSKLPVVVLADGENDLALAEYGDLVLCPPWAAQSLKDQATVIGDVGSCANFTKRVLDVLLKTLTDGSV